MSFKKFFRSSICTAVLCTAVSAQETKPSQDAQPQVNTNKVAGASQGMMSPLQLASCLALDNQEEVILAKFAQETSKNKDVDSFAKMISDEHQSCLKKLAKFAPEASREGYLSDNQPAPNKPNDNPNPSATRKPEQPDQSPANTGAVAGVDMMQLQREIAQQCIADSKKYLSTKPGADFDKCFVGMQIAKHAAMHTKLVVLQRHTTGDMQKIVSEGIEATKKHMDAAELLMVKLDHAGADLTTKETGK